MENLEKGIFNRSELLLGAEMMTKLADTKVIIFGVGGVGSWCAESLVRNGIRHLTIVDSDQISITNCNRQLMATTKTIGMVKVDALKGRLLEINPNAEINALHTIYERESAESFHLGQYDYVIDAIDSLKNKVGLIMHATSIPTLTFFSSMGAALRIDPMKVSTAEFWKVRNDPLGAALRKKLRQKGLKPAKKFICVYSDELPMENKGVETAGDFVADEAPVEHDWNLCKAQINGSLSHITGIFGFTLAGLVMRDIMEKINLSSRER